MSAASRPSTRLSGYVGLWTRLADFRASALTVALEDRSVIQATLMRVTIHIVSRREYWLYALGRPGRRVASNGGEDRHAPSGARERGMQSAADRMRAALAGRPSDRQELGDLATGFVGNSGLWVDLVRVPPAGTWERRRADHLALAEGWVGPPIAPRPTAWRTSFARTSAPSARGVARHRLVGRDLPTRPKRRRGSLDLRSVPRRGRPASSSTSRCATTGPRDRRPRSGSCRTGTRTCWSTPGGPGCFRNPSGHACSRRRTPSPWGRTWSMARGRGMVASRRSHRARSLRRDDGAGRAHDRTGAPGARGLPRPDPGPGDSRGYLVPLTTCRPIHRCHTRPVRSRRRSTPRGRTPPSASRRSGRSARQG